MCGFVGYLSPKGISYEDANHIICKMASSIKHRGPDNYGSWINPNYGIVLGHQRLSIQDLSNNGNQPMQSSSGRYVIVFNGEIYNHFKLRKNKVFRDVHWRGHSDTETILYALDEWGLEKTLFRLNGMFSFALWDNENKSITLVKDRFGEKPLYYGWNNNSFIFGSEIKAIKLHPEFDNEIDRNSIALQMRHCYIPSPYSIFKNLRKVPPGSYIQTFLKDFRKYNNPIKYWDFKSNIESNQKETLNLKVNNLCSSLENLLKDVISDQMISDMPLGAFLSGGIDSSLIVAIMQKLSQKKINTFTIGFEEDEFNEAKYAKKIASHLNTNHKELYVSSSDAIEVIPNLPSIYDEPFSDSSQIPTFLLSKLAKKDVTVALSGDGGDELFGGYRRYKLNKNFINFHQMIPYDLRKNFYNFLDLFPDKFISNMLKKFNLSDGADNKRKIQEILIAKYPEEIYKFLVSHWKNPQELVINSKEYPTALTNNENWPKVYPFVHKMMALDTLMYLPDDILVKVDRAAMAVSLETRIPFLDPRIVDFAWKLPLNTKINNNNQKFILKTLLKNYIPQHLIERPKSGFSIPLANWLRGPLKDWAENLLDQTKIKNSGYLNVQPIRKLWEEHISEKKDNHYYLWDVLMFLSWLEKHEKE